MVYNVGGGSETSLNGAIEMCERLAGKRLKVMKQGAARGDVGRTGADTTLIRSELGWTPRRRRFRKAWRRSSRRAEPHNSNLAAA